MKFIIAAQELNALIAKCQNIISPKPSIPILANFLVEAERGKLIITATDLIVGVRCSAEAKVLQEGCTTLPAKKFAQLVRELIAMTLEVGTNAHEVTEIAAGSSRFKLNGLNKNEGFPSLPSVQEGEQIQLPQSVLKDMLFRTSFAVSREDNRYALTGVYMQIQGGRAVFTGTDGKRLARAQVKLDNADDLTGNYIIPIKAVEEIQKNLSDTEEKALIYLMQDKIGIEANHTLIITKLLTGEYPDVDRIIPSSMDLIIPLHRDELATLLRQVSLFTTDLQHSARFTFLPGELRLSVNTRDLGEGRVAMPVHYQGPRLDIAFNPTFFLDILRHSKSEVVAIGITDPYNPGILTDGQEAMAELHTASPLFVLMPMRLNEE